MKKIIKSLMFICLYADIMAVKRPAEEQELAARRQRQRLIFEAAAEAMRLQPEEQEGITDDQIAEENRRIRALDNAAAERRQQEIAQGRPVVGDDQLREVIPEVQRRLRRLDAFNNNNRVRVGGEESGHGTAKEKYS